ncbi:hypothetical protein KP509_35G013200 [Ceratopteris richardii]|nr:hypothetical protein KP509_35G013200 [Ceratopteris richardii]
MFFEVALYKEHTAIVDSNGASDSSEAKTTHCGVLEFTAPEGYVGLPPHVWLNLGAPDVSLREFPRVRIRYVRLPKCHYAKLTPDSSDFVDVPNHKAVLETKLRQHATLSEGDILTVWHDGVDYNLHVSQLKPAANVSVLETDMEVDVVQPISTPGTSIQNKLLPLELDKPQDGYVEEGKYVYYKFVVEKMVLDAVKMGTRSLDVHLEIDGGGVESDADLYVAAHPVLFPSQHQHQWASHDLGSKMIHLSGGKDLQSSSYSIAVYGYRGRTIYKVWVSSKPTAMSTGQRVGLASHEMQENPAVESGFEICGNCRQVIPSRTIALHEAYCRRHNVACMHPGCSVILRRDEFQRHVHCPKCGQSLQQEELEKHVKVYHEPTACRCGVILERDNMVKHQANTCPLRTITCRFCGDMVQAGKDPENLRDRLSGLTQHESECGSRTSPCEICNRAVMLKEMDLHRVAVHGSNSENRTNSNDGGDVMGINEPASGSEEIRSMTCPICSVVFRGSAADVQLNAHLDSEHFITSSVQPMEQDLTGNSMSASVSSSFRSTLSVACPICGLSVHSERDLSAHMDMVH